MSSAVPVDRNAGWWYSEEVDPNFKGLRPMTPPGDFSKFLKKSDFSKIGQNRLQDRFWAEEVLKFGCCVKNSIETSVQTSISSFFENLVFYNFFFGDFFHF